MSYLIAASVFFLLIHFGVSGTQLRDVLVARMGDGPYRGVFSLASLVGLVWLISAYGHAPTVHLWDHPVSLRPLAYVLVLIAFPLAVIGLITPNPTTAGMESKLTQGADIARGMIRITRHPFLWGVALWALVHLIMNGDAASLILFGSLLLLSVGGTASIDAKRARKFGSEGARFSEATSNVPFAAIAAGRNALGPALREIGILRLIIAVAVYAVLFTFHGRLFGAPLV